MGKETWQEKEKYNKEHYKKCPIQLNKNLVAEWEEQLKIDNLTKAKFLRDAINQYLAENKEPRTLEPEK